MDHDDYATVSEDTLLQQLWYAFFIESLKMILIPFPYFRYDMSKTYVRNNYELQ